jgi:hypothetical protein
MWWDELLRVVQDEREGVIRNAKTIVGGSRRTSRNQRSIEQEQEIFNTDNEHDSSDDEI